MLIVFSFFFLCQQVKEEVSSIWANAVNLCMESGVEQDEDIPVKQEHLDVVWFITPKQAALHLEVREI